ncbi:MAG: hypothetical protein ACSLE2_03930, partial [Lysobacterales bacterium]
MTLRRYVCGPLFLFVLLLSVAGNAAAQSLLLEEIVPIIDDGGDGIVNPGDTITFEFLVTNGFAEDLVDVSVDPGNQGVNILTPLAQVAEGQSVQIIGEYTLTPSDIQAGQVALVAPYAFGVFAICNGNCGPTQSAPASNVIVNWENPVADLTVTKTDSADPVSAGDQLTYFVRVDNLGPDVA